MMRSLRMLVTALVMLVAGCGPTVKDKYMAHDLASNMKTVCMGRFVMQVPQDMSVNGDVTLYFGLGKDFKTVDLRIESLNSTSNAMKETVAAEARKIDKSDKNRRTGKSMLLDYQVIDNQLIYLRKYDSIISAAASNHRIYVLAGAASLLLTADSYEGVREAGRFEPDGMVETPEEVKARLMKVARQIRAYDDPEKAGPGFCLGPVVIDSDQDDEKAKIRFRMDRHPDLLLDIYSKRFTPDSQETLLGNMSRLEEYSSVRVLRKGGRAFAGMSGTEWLGRFTDEHDVERLTFTAWSSGGNRSLGQPKMTIGLETGGQLPEGPNAGKYVDSSLTTAEGVALWEEIIESIQPRRNAVGPGTYVGQSSR